jgi:nicotinate dehydrogenase large molybdopterin subunit
MAIASERVRFKVNGRDIERDVAVSTTLHELLHDMVGCEDVKYGCGEGVCGACTVLIDGEPQASCIQLALQVDGLEIVTASGLQDHAPPHIRSKLPRLVEHLVAREAFQCGYCAPGMLVSAAHAIAGSTALSPDELRHKLSGNICRCSGYQQIFESLIAAARGQAAPPVQHPRQDIREKVFGRARFPSDVFPTGEKPLIARIVWSEHPHADICNIDTTGAAAIPGVVALLTSQDIPGKNICGTTLFGADQPMLAEHRVRCMGDPVALVAATSLDAAERAVQAIRVHYAPLPYASNVLQALDEGAPRLRKKGNVVAQFTKVQGDVDAALRATDVSVIEDIYQSSINDHACMEMEGGVGWMEGRTIVLCVTTLTPHEVRKSVARSLGVSEALIRIETPAMGGSFGKYLVPGLEPHLALLVRQTGRPVRLFLSRDEILTRRPKRHPFWGRYRLGVKRDGTFTALDADVIADAGAYISLTPAVASVFADEANGAYEIPNLRIRARGVLTNNPPGAPMRGFGSQQASFGIESIVEKAARTLGFDPAEIRRKNFLRTRLDSRGREREDTGISLAETLDVVAKSLNQRPSAPQGWVAGRGLASIRAKYGYPYGVTDRFVARVTVQKDGRFLVEADIADSGTGMASSLPCLVARAFQLKRLPDYRVNQSMIDDPSGDLLSGRPRSAFRKFVFQFVEALQTVQAAEATAFMSRLPPERLAVILRLIARPVNFAGAFVAHLKSWLFPLSVDSYAPRTSGSRGMLMAGRAVVAAVSKLGDAALAMASEVLKLPRSALVINDDGISDRDDPKRSITWVELASMAGGQLQAIGDAELPSGYILSPSTGNQLGCIDHMYVTQACDVAVNPSTGEVRVLRFVACHDVGKVINPETIRGQIIGSIVMGIGQALWENIPAEGGRVQITGLHDYHIATSLDAPADIEIHLIESGTGFGPDGAKGAGEGGAVAAPIAVANAIYDALRVQVTSITSTPEDIARLTSIDP